MRNGSAGRRRFSNRQLQILDELTRAIGQKDPYTQAHSQRVALYAMRLARRLGLSEKEIRDVGIGGLFHDVGKLALSDRVFSNRDTILPSDLQHEVHCHPLIGAALLKEVDCLGPIVDFVLFHHEREDGKGYPFGLTAAEIPPGAKIVSITDCFDAVTTDRPYQERKSIASAYEILRDGCRRFFCEAYVEVFIEDIEEFGIVKGSVPSAFFTTDLIRSADRYTCA